MIRRPPRSTRTDTLFPYTTLSDLPNAQFADTAFAVFMGAAGTVTVDRSLGDVEASGMQFLTDGYVIEGDAIILAGTQATIRVGDGTAAGAGTSATINAELTGARSEEHTPELLSLMRLSYAVYGLK